MAASFNRVESLPTEVKLTGPEGRVVLSQLGRGDAPIYCATPCLKFVLEGEERYEVEGRLEVVRPGEFLVVDAGVSLRALLPFRRVTTGLCIYLPVRHGLPYVTSATDGFGAGVGRARQRTIIQSASSTAFGDRLRRAAVRLAAEPGAGHELADGIAAASAAEFLGFSGTISHQLDQLTSAKPSTRRDLLHRLDVARGYLHDHQDRAVALDELASVAGLSQFHLARSFRAVYGQPPAAYHRARRLEKAAALLAGGHVTATAAAHAFGFSELSTFTRSFKQKYGVPPSAFHGQATP